MKSGESTSVFDLLNTDLKLYLFSRLSKKDVGALCQANKNNAKILDKPRFWQQRALLDQHHNIPPNAYAKGIYLNNYQDTHIQKIVDLLHFTVGIDRTGHLHVLPESVRNTAEASRQLQMLKNFAHSHRILDIQSSSGGSVYIRTEDGVYGFGSNFYGQFGSDSKDTHFDYIHLLQRAHPNKEILQVGAGMDFSMVRTHDELTLRGKISLKKNNLMKFRGDNIIDVKCSTRKAYVLKRDQQLYAVDDGMKLVREFAGKKVREVQTNNGQTVVWCSDGIYVDGHSENGNLGLFQAQVSFSQLPGFDDKKIFSVYLGTCHMVIHCEDGIYVSGLNNVGRLGTGDFINRLAFTKLDLDQNQVTNIHLTSNSFIEIDSTWRMAGTFAGTHEVERHKATFQPVQFR